MHYSLVDKFKIMIVLLPFNFLKNYLSISRIEVEFEIFISKINFTINEINYC